MKILSKFNRETWTNQLDCIVCQTKFEYSIYDIIAWYTRNVEWDKEKEKKCYYNVEWDKEKEKKCYYITEGFRVECPECKFSLSVNPYLPSYINLELKNAVDLTKMPTEGFFSKEGKLFSTTCVVPLPKDRSQLKLRDKKSRPK